MVLVKIRSSRHAARSWLQLALVVLSLFTLVSGVEARETYVQFASRLLSQPPDGAEIRPDMEAAILSITNGARAAKDYAPLRIANKKLSMAARAHAMDLLATSAMGHQSSTGYNFESRMRAVHDGQMILAPMAENAARLRNSQLSETEMAKALVKQWMNSPGHRKNIVNRTYTQVAIGVVKQGNTVYAVQIFSGPQVKTNMFGTSTGQ